MKLAIMQPYLFPYIGYFQLISAVDKFIILDDVNFIKKGWINRNRILLNGKDYLFTLPIRNASQNKLINEIDIADTLKWKRKFLLTIETAYKKAPEFNVINELIISCFENGLTNISAFLTNSLRKISVYLDIKTKIVETSSVYKTKSLKREEKIVSICKQERATEYFNPIGGKELYKKEMFNENGVKLNFIKTGNVSYTQFSDNFVPHLSIIDALMFNSKAKAKYFLSQFDLE